MLDITIVAVGTKLPEWATQGYREYQTRLTKIISLNLIEVPSTTRRKGVETAVILKQESASIKNSIPKNSYLIALDRLGKQFDSILMSQRFDLWMQTGRNKITFIIGGADGISSELLSLVDEKWQLSSLTFSHSLARLILAEQIYRCYTLLIGHPYHK